MNNKILSSIFILLSIYSTNSFPLSKRSCSASYKIIDGDTCYKIWTKHGLSESYFKSINSGINCSSLQTGDSVCVDSNSSNSSNGCSAHYSIIKGDTCYKIWTLHGLTESYFKSINPGIDCFKLIPDTKVCVAGNIGSNNNSSRSKKSDSCILYHSVIKEDTCRKIWTKYGINESTLRNLNPNLVCSQIHIGQKLCVKNSLSRSSHFQSSSTNHTISHQSPSFTWYRECNIPNSFAITFDDGPYNYDNELLDLLKRKGVKATFFINGLNVSDIRTEKIGAIIKRMYKEGHNVLSHTWSHQYLTKISDTKFRSELKLLEDQIYNIIGKRPKALRPPFGSNNNKVANNLEYFGYPYGILWNIDTKDWENKGNVNQIHQIIKKGLNISNSPIILNHSFYKGITKEKLLKLVESEIDYLISKGLNGVNMETCIGHKVYRSSGENFPN